MLILLSGLAGCGKDTFADYLCKHHSFQKRAFADVLKREVSDLYNIPLNYFYDRDKKDTNYHGITPREKLIDYANQKRKIDPLYFAKKIELPEGNVVISDCGFLNEQEYFPEGITVWIERSIPEIFDNREIQKSDCKIILYNESPFDGDKLWEQFKKNE